VYLQQWPTREAAEADAKQAQATLGGTLYVFPMYYVSRELPSGAENAGEWERFDGEPRPSSEGE
jgi:hypothetical protein